jgi:hypothetical protein
MPICVFRLLEEPGLLTGDYVRAGTPATKHDPAVEDIAEINRLAALC